MLVCNHNRPLYLVGSHVCIVRKLLPSSVIAFPATREDALLLGKTNATNTTMMETSTASATESEVLAQQQQQQQQTPTIPTTQKQQYQLQLHLVIANIQKRRNVQALIGTALAFGVSHIHVVGLPSLDFNPDSPQNSLPALLRQALVITANDDDYSTTAAVPGQAVLRRFAKWKDVVTHLQKHDIPLVGVEIDARAVSVDELLTTLGGQQQQQQHLALVMGNEGQGLQPHQMADCQHLVRLPQYGSGTASYNVYVAASLVLHRLHQYQITFGR